MRIKAVLKITEAEMRHVCLKEKICMGLVDSDNCLNSLDFPHTDSLSICVVIESTY